MAYGLHFNPEDIEKLYNYTDDLLIIHRQLVAYMLDNDMPVGVQVLKTDVAMRTLFRCDVLETPMHLSAKEGKSKYAVKYTEHINEIYRDAHLLAIKEFHSCWGVLPNTALDDYRSVGITPLSLSQDFIEEAMASNVVSVEPINVTLFTERYQVHQAVAGSDKQPVYVRTAEQFARDRAYWLLSQLPAGGIEIEYSANEYTFHVNESSKDAFVYEGKLYVPVGSHTIEGTGWADSIEWYTQAELDEMYDA
jgi:hypothetical protein